jgi:hypothetical protein
LWVKLSQIVEKKVKNHRYFASIAKVIHKKEKTLFLVYIAAAAANL